MPDTPIVTTDWCTTSSCHFFWSDVLLANLVSGAIPADEKENYNKAPNQRTCKHVDALLSAVRSCGVCFSFWEKRDANGHRRTSQKKIAGGGGGGHIFA